LPAVPFDFPLGIALWPSELRANRGRFVEGYDYSRLENSGDSFRFTAMAGAGRIAELLRSFAACLPEESFLILEFYQEELEGETKDNPSPVVYYSPYLLTEEILTFLEPYLPRLIHDGFVGFGLANNREGMELFYSEEKVLTCFTSNHIQIMNMLARSGLPHTPDLVFPTDFGHDHLSLLCHPPHQLPEPFASMTEQDLDYVQFCQELTEQLEMYPVEENLAFFLSKKEQDQIGARLCHHPEFAEFAEEDFGSLLLDWNDFVDECTTGFQGDLWEYRQGLKLRDVVQYAAEGVDAELGRKLLEIVKEADECFSANLTDRRKRLDPPGDIPVREERFWYQGMVRIQGAELRRDLIRHGWYQP
jgi:hypothetical protein